MQTERLTRLFRRIASLVLVICFVLPLSQCDFKKQVGEKTVPVQHRVYGYHLVVGGLQEIKVSNVAGGLAGIAAGMLVFFLPLAMWKVSDVRQALVHVIVSPFAGYVVYLLVFVLSTRALVGGILLAVAWAAIFLSGCTTLIQVIADRRK